MTQRIHKLLYDVLLAAEQIEAFVADVPTFAAYLSDPRTQSAVSWQLVIIGEATNKLRREEPSVVMSASQEIIGLRNRLVHAYDTIDDGAVLEDFLAAVAAAKTQD